MVGFAWSRRAGIALLILAVLVLPSLQTAAVPEGDAPAVPHYNALSGAPPASPKGVETFDSLPNGLKSPSTIDLGMGTLTLHDLAKGGETVILGGQLVSIVREPMSNAAVMSFTPKAPEGTWTMSSEVYPSKDRSVHHSYGVPAPCSGMMITLESGGEAVAAAALYVGESGQEGVRVRLGQNGGWTTVLDDVLPGYSSRHDPSPASVRNQEGMYGNRPDHYVVGFEHLGDEVSISIHYTAGGASELLYRNSVVSGPMVAPRMVYSADAEIIRSVEDYIVMNCWYIDNMRFTNDVSRYAETDPSYEYIFKGQPAYLSLRDLDNLPITDASVTIGGRDAAYVAEHQRYEAYLGQDVDWATKVPYSVDVDDHSFDGVLHITTMSELAYGVDLPLWWNGWDWVSVFGVDDPGPSNALSTYYRYEHPVSSYMISPSGTSEMMLPTHSELAVHAPHDYRCQGTKLWDEAVAAARSGRSGMEGWFAYASRWDDPSYVGRGDTYITKACPANWGSPAMVYAMHDEGFRIMGRTASYCSAVSTHLMGAWWDGSDANAWYPYEPVQLMNIMRSPCTDGEVPRSTWDWVRDVASKGGVVSSYNHGSYSSSAADLLRWMDTPKTDFDHENWKATNGEVASYVFGRWTTDASYNAAMSNGSALVYDVSRQDPHARGYWNVPVTLSFDLSMLPHGVSDIVLSEGDRTYRASDGTLAELQAARVMDVGYDIRDGALYVSHFWNSSSRLTLLSLEGVELPPQPPRPAWPSTPGLPSTPEQPGVTPHPVDLSANGPFSAWVVGSVVATAAAVFISFVLVMRRRGGTGK